MTDPTVPDRVSVGGLTYRIITDAEEIQAVSDASDAADKGGEWKAFSDHDRLLIGLPPDDADDANRMSLVHELLHCCLRMGGVWPDMYARVLDDARNRDAGISVEEFTVSGIAGPLLAVLRDNPDVLSWLTQRDAQPGSAAAERVLTNLPPGSGTATSGDFHRSEET